MAKLAMGELESQVMDVLWDAGRPLTAGEVHDVLRKRRRIAYTTVMTILVRLWEKGRVDRERDGRAYAYVPTATRAEHAAARMHEILDAVGDHSAALTHFLNTLAPGDRARLRRILGGAKRK